MKKAILLYILLFFTFYIQALDNSSRYLFINTNPIRAKVIIDGVDKGVLTPCLIRDMDPKAKTLKLVKDGYKDQIIDLTRLKTKKIDIYLTSLTFDLYFPENKMYKIGDISKKGPFMMTRIEQGTYQFSTANNKINFRKISPFSTSEIILGTCFGISASCMFASIGLTEYYRYRSDSTTVDFDSRHYDLLSRGFDISKYASISITSLIGIALMSIIIADAASRYNQKKTRYEMYDNFPEDESKKLYDNALDFLSKGEIDRSINVLQSLVAMYPGNDYMSMAYYQLGQDYFILKEYDKALENWEIFIKDYPEADYYDYVLKNIADIYYLRKDYKMALLEINKVLFTENILDRETILAFRAKVNFELYNEEKNSDYFRLTENQYLLLLDNFPSSDRIASYYEQLIKLYNAGGNTDKLNELKKRAGSIPDESIRNIVLSLFK